LQYSLHTPNPKSYNRLLKSYWTRTEEWAYVHGRLRPFGPLEEPMNILDTPIFWLSIVRSQSLRWIRPGLSVFAFLIVFAPVAFGQSPFDTGFTALQTLFTGTVAKVASLIAIVVGGYEFAHGEPGAKKTLAGVAAGTGIAVLATNVLTWLWGV
jgi:type IV secretory pathway VirB2 component (pilin)